MRGSGLQGPLLASVISSKKTGGELHLVNLSCSSLLGAGSRVSNQACTVWSLPRGPCGLPPQKRAA